MPNVFYTWLGPPQQANKTILGLDGQHRPDLFGILRTARSSFTNDPPPYFTLCVLEKFKRDFDALLPSYVATLAVDTAFDSSRFSSIVMAEPDLDNLDVTVDYIIRQTLKVRGTGYDSRLLPYKELAFVKDLWSLYCVWKYGGYHLDSGVYPLPERAVLSFPEPQGFDVPTLDSEDARRDARHCVMKFKTGKPICVTLRGLSTIFETYVMKDRVTVTATESHLRRLIDVWLIRSPAGDPSARRALEVYVRGWFELQAWVSQSDENAKAKAEVLRELIVSAALTGVTHAGSANQCANKRAVDSHLICGVNKVVDDLGLVKVGFKSHR
jgi:hypothetical protein